ncbi:uncharacterized protein B0I36DRAFT_359796 [Microdochium trichocladiopsis]|uniref:Uncharacterized protein n=1 Tax=Microdochium trichocladiopsis TaxID=1682393 RepID=A0A9P9BV77_9PEZI|nr:uncharacterized protein B0I36DRAFT_359796 [Microdochium trichocladiopsis]KAH7038204.1 hypothetical protein B0I36DRAFT_359796 [Microdochium trichocladiopsis]
MGVASGIGHLVQSVIEVFQGIFATIFHIFEGAISAVLHFFQLVFDSVLGLFKGVAHFVENTLGFAIHNFFILGTIAAVVFGYLLFSQRQGTTPVSRTIKNK